MASLPASAKEHHSGLNPWKMAGVSPSATTGVSPLASTDNQAWLDTAKPRTEGFNQRSKPVGKIATDMATACRLQASPLDSCSPSTTSGALSSENLYTVPSHKHAEDYYTDSNTGIAMHAPEASGHEFRSSATVETFEKLTGKHITMRPWLERSERDSQNTFGMLLQDHTSSIDQATANSTETSGLQAKHFQHKADGEDDLQDGIGVPVGIEQGSVTHDYDGHHAHDYYGTTLSTTSDSSTLITKSGSVSSPATRTDDSNIPTTESYKSGLAASPAINTDDSGASTVELSKSCLVSSTATNAELGSRGPSLVSSVPVRGRVYLDRDRPCCGRDGLDPEKHVTIKQSTTSDRRYLASNPEPSALPAPVEPAEPASSAEDSIDVGESKALEPIAASTSGEQRPTGFHSRDVPRRSVADYFGRLRLRMSSSSEGYGFGFVYLERLTKRCPNAVFSPWSSPRSMVTNTIPTVTFRSCAHPGHAFNAKVGGVPLAEFGSLQKHPIHSFSWSLNVTEGEYIAYSSIDSYVFDWIKYSKQIHKLHNVGGMTEPAIGPKAEGPIAEESQPKNGDLYVDESPSTMGRGDPVEPNASGVPLVDGSYTIPDNGCVPIPVDQRLSVVASLPATIKDLALLCAVSVDLVYQPLRAHVPLGGEAVSEALSTLRLPEEVSPSGFGRFCSALTLCCSPLPLSEHITCLVESISAKDLLTKCVPMPCSFDMALLLTMGYDQDGECDVDIRDDLYVYLVSTTGTTMFYSINDQILDEEYHKRTTLQILNLDPKQGTGKRFHQLGDNATSKVLFHNWSGAAREQSERLTDARRWEMVDRAEQNLGDEGYKELVAPDGATQKRSSMTKARLQKFDDVIGNKQILHRDLGASFDKASWTISNAVRTLEAAPVNDDYEKGECVAQYSIAKKPNVYYEFRAKRRQNRFDVCFDKYVLPKLSEGAGEKLQLTAKREVDECAVSLTTEVSSEVRPSTRNDSFDHEDAGEKTKLEQLKATLGLPTKFLHKDLGGKAVFETARSEIVEMLDGEGYDTFDVRKGL